MSRDFIQSTLHSPDPSTLMQSLFDEVAWLTSIAAFTGRQFVQYCMSDERSTEFHIPARHVRNGRRVSQLRFRRAVKLFSLCDNQRHQSAHFTTRLTATDVCFALTHQSINQLINQSIKRYTLSRLPRSLSSQRRAVTDVGLRDISC